MEGRYTYVLSAKELIGNSTLNKITPNTKIAKKTDVINYYHFDVPVYINVHGWMVDVVAEETKKSGAARPQNNSAASTQATTQHNNNVTLSNVQVNRITLRNFWRAGKLISSKCLLLCGTFGKI